MTAHQTPSASYEIGYRKPPRHTQFQKGQSGNPGGRPRRTATRFEELALYEAYRSTVVTEYGRAEPVPVIQAVLRRQFESAAGGNVRATRDILAMIRDIEQARDLAGLLEDDVANDDNDDDADDADDGSGNGVDDNDVDDDASADHHDAGGADDDDPTTQQADGIDGPGRSADVEPARTSSALHPPLKEQGRIAEGDPGRGGGGAGDDTEATRTEALSPPPGPRTGADPGSSPGQALPPPGPPWGGEETPARRRRGPAVNAGKIRGGHSASSRRSQRRRNAGPARRGLRAGTPVRRPPLLNETKN